MGRKGDVLFINKKRGQGCDRKRTAPVLLKGKSLLITIPKSFIFLQQIPKTPVGKIDKKALLKIEIKQ